MDEEFLVISDHLPTRSGQPDLDWQYVDVYQLIDILSVKIDFGYTFPLNPKWVICDKGWKNLWDKLMASSKANSRGALDCWFPKKSGVREKIESIYERFPNGFQMASAPAGAAAAAGAASASPAIEDLCELDAEMAMELANYELIQYLLDMDQAKKGGKDKASAGAAGAAGAASRASMPGAYSSSDAEMSAAPAVKPGAYSSTDGGRVSRKITRASYNPSGSSYNQSGRPPRNVSMYESPVSSNAESGEAKPAAAAGGGIATYNAVDGGYQSGMSTRMSSVSSGLNDDGDLDTGYVPPSRKSSMDSSGHSFMTDSDLGSDQQMPSFRNGPKKQISSVVSGSSRSMNSSLVSAGDEESLTGVNESRMLSHIRESDREHADSSRAFTKGDDESKAVNSKRWALLAGTFVCVAVVVLVLVLVLGGKSETPGTNGGEPSSSNTAFDDQRAILQSQLAYLSSDPSVLERNVSPQGLALDWLTNEILDGTDGDMMDDSRIEARYALATLFFATAGSKWTDSTRFITSAHECDWKGVSCNSDLIPTHLDFQENNLLGSIPEEIAVLTALESILLNGNTISNKVPFTIGRLTGLVQLDLSNNFLTGSLPVEIGDLSKLQLLGLGKNQLSSSLPTSILKMKALQKLDVNGNQFTGQLPELATLPQLNIFEGEANEFTGSLDSIWSRSLRFVHVPMNRFSGPFPTSIVDASTLEYFSCFDNQISGTVPPGIGTMRNLRFLYMDNNFVTGTFPWSDFSDGAALEGLVAGGNSWDESQLPNDIGRLSSLKEFDMMQSQLAGPIPDSLYQLTELRRISLRSNFLSGTLSNTTLSQLSNLEHVEFGLNADVGGSIPNEIGELTTLTHLGFGSCSLSGTIPASMGSLTKLWSLNLSQNRLTGNIPTELGSLQQLRKLVRFVLQKSAGYQN